MQVSKGCSLRETCLQDRIHNHFILCHKETVRQNLKTEEYVSNESKRKSYNKAEINNLPDKEFKIKKKVKSINNKNADEIWGKNR